MSTSSPLSWCLCTSLRPGAHWWKCGFIYYYSLDIEMGHFSFINSWLELKQFSFNIRLYLTKLCRSIMNLVYFVLCGLNYNIFYNQRAGKRWWCWTVLAVARHNKKFDQKVSYYLAPDQLCMLKTTYTVKLLSYQSFYQIRIENKTVLISIKHISASVSSSRSCLNHGGAQIDIWSQTWAGPPPPARGHRHVAL